MRLLLLAALAALAACSSGSGPEDAPPCSNGLAFTVLPVPLDQVAIVSPVGSMGPPVHTIPTDHAGFYVNGAGIPLLAPAAARVTSVSRTRYLVSPFRQGQADHSLVLKLCGSFTLRFSHIVTVSAPIAAEITTSGCERYSTANEAVESCTNDHASVEVTAGETLGTVGGPTAGAFDFGLYDAGHDNYFVNPGRYSGATRTAVCPYDPFPATIRDQLFARITADGLPSSGESPRCGSMSVDVAGTAMGVWVLQSQPVSQMGDETNFLALAPHPMFPQSRQTFSAGPAAIAAPFGVSAQVRYPRQASGRVNRVFSDVHGDGLIYCYVFDGPNVAVSYLIRLAANQVLTIQRVTHPVGASPCNNDPATWTLGATALAFIR